MSFTVRVRNFQSIEDATLLVDGLTVITGTNNTGKSAFFRALRGVFTNTKGHGFVRNGTSHCTVDVDFNDGQVQWEKGPKANRYKVGPLVLSKVGHGAPPEVQALGVRSLPVAGQEIWPQIAPQISGVQFLLDQPAPVLAESLADVERVNHLNRALRACEADRKQARSDLKAHEELLQSLTVQNQQFDNLDQDLAVYTDLEREHGELTLLRAEIMGLESLSQRLQVNRKVLASLDGLEQIVLPSDEDMGQLGRLHQAVVVVTEISQRLSKARETSQRYGDGGLLESLHLDIQRVVNPIRDLEEIVSQAKHLEQMRQRIHLQQEEIQKCDHLHEAVRQTHGSAVDAVKQALGAFTECPTCGGDFHG